MAALSRHVASHDQLLGRANLQLEPRRGAAAGLVPAATVLCHRSLEALGRGRREERDAVALHVPAEAHARVLAQDEAQDRLPILERHVEVGPAGTPGQVEGHEEKRRGPARRARPAAGGEVGRAEAAAEASLQEAEIGASVRVEGDNLAVDDRLRRGEPGRLPEQLREETSSVVSVPRPQRHVPAGDNRLDPVAIPLGLEQPLVVIEGGGPRGC